MGIQGDDRDGGVTWIGQAPQLIPAAFCLARDSASALGPHNGRLAASGSETWRRSLAGSRRAVNRPSGTWRGAVVVSTVPEAVVGLVAARENVALPPSMM
jgi:hypothetical protein